MAEGFADNWTIIAIAGGVAVLLIGILFLASYLLAPRRQIGRGRIPYECGIEASPFSWSRTNIRYYVFGLAFLIFDVEVVFLFPWSVIFLEATDEALVRRFSETRRPHPLAPDRSVIEGISEERKRLNKIRDDADYVFDTSKFTVHELRRSFMGLSVGEASAELVVTLLSFGYKFGVPLESDVMFDVRFLMNPHFDSRLRDLTGRDSAVQEFLAALQPCQRFLEKTVDLLDFLVPEYKEEGKKYLTIGIGCTGGRHRSVYIAERLAECMSLGSGVSLNIHHRDIGNR